VARCSRRVTTKNFKIESGQHQTLNNSGFRETEQESNENLSVAFLNKYKVRGLLKWDCWCLLIKPIYQTQRLNPAARWYKHQPLTIFLAIAKRKKN
jgi:hypothetical protein